MQYMVHMYHTCESNNSCPSPRPSVRSMRGGYRFGRAICFEIGKCKKKNKENNMEKNNNTLLIESTCYEEFLT